MFSRGRVWLCAVHCEFIIIILLFSEIVSPSKSLLFCALIFYVLRFLLKPWIAQFVQAGNSVNEIIVIPKIPREKW